MARVTIATISQQEQIKNAARKKQELLRITT
jgi:hypothetical protein